jgi:hypothetical protein
MRKLVLSGICVLASALALACSSSSANQGADFDHGTGGASSGTGGASSGGSGGGSTQNAPYPAGPYGYDVGSTIGPGTQYFYGWKDPVAAGYDTNNLKKIYLSDFYDPDGSKNTKVILLNVSARWCVVCQGEYSEIEQQNKYSQYKAKGAEFFGVLFEDLNQNPAQPLDLKLWTKDYGVHFPMVTDPSFWFGHFFTADATPMNLVINASNMKIVGQVLGGDTTTIWNQVDSALANAK